MFLYHRLFAVWFVFLSTIFAAHSCIVTHFELFQEEGQNRLRVVSFDTKTQMMLHHETMAYAVFDKPWKEFLRQYYPPALPAPQDRELSYRIQLTAEGNIQIVPPAVPAPAGISRETYLMVTARPLISLAGGVVALNPDFQKNYWVSAVLPMRTPAEITALVPPVPAREAAGNFATINPFTPAHVLNQLRSISSDRKGELGELVTILSAFSYGYAVKPSKYEGNHGLDGIFLRFDGQYLIISQTKAGDSNDRAPTVMKNELNEKHMSDRLQKMLDSNIPAVILSANLVLQFLRDNPANVVKMSHCLLDKGKAQLLINPVDVTAFPESGPVKLFAAAQEDKQNAIRKKVESFAPDPAEQLRLALASLNLGGLNQEQIMRIVMQHQGVDAERQNQVVELLEEE